MVVVIDDVANVAVGGIVAIVLTYVVIKCCVQD